MNMGSDFKQTWNHRDISTQMWPMNAGVVINLKLQIGKLAVKRNNLSNMPPFPLSVLIHNFHNCWILINFNLQGRWFIFHILTKEVLSVACYRIV